MKNKNSTTCLICNRTFTKPSGLSTHIRHSHDISKEDYYNTYVDCAAGKCLTCGGKTRFISIPEGYRTFCSIACRSKNPELAKQQGRTLAALHQKDPSIRQKSAAKRKKTLYLSCQTYFPTYCKNRGGHKYRKAYGAPTSRLRAS